MNTFRTFAAAMLTVMLMTIAALGAATPSASAAAVDEMVDCSDSFWAIACGLADDPYVIDSMTVEIEVEIDADPTCVTLPSGLLYCHS